LGGEQSHVWVVRLFILVGLNELGVRSVLAFAVRIEDRLVERSIRSHDYKRTQSELTRG
jgi:hypothetical protein